MSKSFSKAVSISPRKELPSLLKEGIASSHLIRLAKGSKFETVSDKNEGKCILEPTVAEGAGRWRGGLATERGLRILKDVY